MRLDERDNSQTAHVLCSFPGGIDVHYTISLPDDSAVSTWQLELDNRGGATRNDDRRVYRVAFPVIDRLAIDGDSKDDWLARPFAQGELIRNPVDHHYTMYWQRKGAEKRTYVLTYIGWASMPWLDLYDENGGLYLASYDPSFEQIDLETWPDRAGRTMTLDIRTLAFTEPKQRWKSQTFAVGIHSGDWHWAADTYRGWAKQNHRPFAGPSWVRETCDGWFGTGGPVRYETYPRMLEDARWLGLDYLQIWSEMLENVGPNKQRKGYYAFLLPDPDRGGEAAIETAIKQVRAAGGHIGFYHNVWTWDAEMEQSLEQWKEHIPPDVKVPRWWGEFRRCASVFSDGSRRAGNFLNGYAGMCQAAEKYQNYVISWVVDRYVKRYGADAWYFDSMPVTMFAASRVCFSDEHGPRQPHGVGRGCLQMMQRVYEAARPHVNLAMTSETVSDALMQYNSHALGIEMVGGITPYPKPEIYTYTFPEHAIFSGSCNNQLGLREYYPDEEPSSTLGMKRVFLMGYRFDVLAGRVNPDSPYHQFLRRLIGLRKKLKADIYGAEFRDDIGLGGLPERVEAKLFRRRDGRRLCATVLDRRGEAAEPWTLALKLEAHDFPTPAAATLYTLDGEEKPLIFTTSTDRRLEVPLPRLTGGAAAIVFQRGTSR